MSRRVGYGEKLAGLGTTATDIYLEVYQLPATIDHFWHYEIGVISYI